MIDTMLCAREVRGTRKTRDTSPAAKAENGKAGDIFTEVEPIQKQGIETRDGDAGNRVHDDRVDLL